MVVCDRLLTGTNEYLASKCSIQQFIGYVV